MYKQDLELNNIDIQQNTTNQPTNFSLGKQIYKNRRFSWCNGYRRKEMVMKTRVQILDETESISHSFNTLAKGMNPIILPPTVGKLFFIFG